MYKVWIEYYCENSYDPEMSLWATLSVDTFHNVYDAIDLVAKSTKNNPLHKVTMKYIPFGFSE